MLLLGAALSVTNISAAEGDAERARLEQLKRDIGSLNSSIKQQKTAQERANNELRKIDRNMDRTARKLRRIQRQMTDIKARIATLEKKRLAASRMFDSHHGILRQQLLARYQMGRKSELQMLLDKRGAIPVGRMIAYHRYIQGALLEELEIVRQSLAGFEDAVAGKRLARERLAQTLAAQKDLLARQQKEERARKAVISKLGREIKASSERLRQAKENERRLMELLNRFERKVKDHAKTDRDFSRLKGQLPWPVIGDIEARFGRLRNRQGIRWTGVMIGAKSGTPVIAVASGKVIYADWLRGFGLLLIVDHGSGFMSLYGHNQSLFKSIGETVVQGEEVSRVGASGGILRPALYFEIRHNGHPSNPELWLEKRHG